MVQLYSPGSANVHPHLIHASSSPQVHIAYSILISSAIVHSSRQTVSILYNGPPILPLKITQVRTTDLHTQLIHGSLYHHIQHPKWLTTESPYTSQWTALFPQNCPFARGIWTLI